MSNTPTIFLDLSRDARRDHLLALVMAHLDQKRREEVVHENSLASVPQKHHHNLAAVTQTIEALPVASAVKKHLSDVYTILATAEAQVHGSEIELTHFHEVGNAPGLQNSVLICLAFDKLAPCRVTASSVQTGAGKVQCAHGLIDIPAPATSAILSLGIPVCESKFPGELCTPTSAAIIKHFVNEFI